MIRRFDCRRERRSYLGSPNFVDPQAKRKCRNRASSSSSLSGIANLNVLLSILASNHTIELSSCLLTLHSQSHDRTRRFPAIITGQTRVIPRVVAAYTLQHQTLGAHDDAGRIVLREPCALSLVDY